MQNMIALACEVYNNKVTETSFARCCKCYMQFRVCFYTTCGEYGWVDAMYLRLRKILSVRMSLYQHNHACDF